MAILGCQLDYIWNKLQSRTYKDLMKKKRMVVHAFNPSIQEVEAGRSLEFRATLDYKSRPGQQELCELRGKYVLRHAKPQGS